MTNIVTAVRVRPFSDKEKKENSLNVISMNGNETKIELKGKSFSFNFDHSFWSHDGYSNNDAGYTLPTNPKYTDQKKLFENLGKPLIENAWKGYNCSLFAYGQTGSGKTYSVMGYKENKGLVPMICEDLFDGISKAALNLKENEKYQVTMGMIEIYNEKVRDLLNPTNSESLSLKENIERGFYAPNQLMVHVDSYINVLQKIELGNKLRTIASTNMNATSSRAHTMVSLEFKQILMDDKKKSTTKTSFINLVDLAGSEQVKKSLAEGSRMVEAQNINKSLHILGMCLNNISTNQSHVPYRDSVLTKLLMNALGGNSKTIVLAALSPSSNNFDESLSTLRFTERAKKVLTKAKINISETNVIIKNLKEENERLLQLIKELKENKSTKTSIEDNSKLMEELQDQVQRNTADVDSMAITWKEQAKQAHAELERQNKIEEERKLKLKQVPHMYNLNEDPALNKVLVYLFDKPVTVIGNSKVEKDASIKNSIDVDLQGLNILSKHAEIRQDKATNKTFIKPIGNAIILINGVKITKEQELKHFDRILLGNSLYFFHYDPLNDKQDPTTTKEPTIDDARQEITEKSEEFKGVDNKRLLEDLSSIYPLVSEVNVMAKEMNKKVIYSLLIFNANLPGYNDSSESQVRVRVLLTSKKYEYFLEIDEFKDLRYGMLDAFQDFKDGGIQTSDQASMDPFIPTENDLCCVGFSQLLLEPIKYLLDISDKLLIFNYQGKEVGLVHINVVPCDSVWNASEVKEDGIEIGSKIFVKISITKVQLDKTLFKKIYYRFKFYDRNVKSPMSDIINEAATFNIDQKIDGMLVDDKILSYLSTEMLNVEIWGCYGDSAQSPIKAPPSTSGVTQPKNTPNSNPLFNDNVAVQKFLGDFQTMIEQRQKEGGTNIDISEIEKLVPKDLKNSAGGNGSVTCVIQ